MTHMDTYIIPAGRARTPPPASRGSTSRPSIASRTAPLYAGREKIYPKLAHGRFRTVKWLVMAVTLGIYYALPWLRWHRGPDLPDQAVLLDMANNRFFFFFLEIWPQEFYFVTGLLVLAALTLFLVTSVAGRVWCGYTCPQTVWTDLMIVVERFWQGDRNARMRLDKERWGPVKLFKKGMTHLSWLAIGLATGGAFVFYFRDAPTLAAELLSGTAPAIAYLFLGIFTLTTYVLGGIAREQVCIYMCPWPRIQGAMVDRETLLVSYRVVSRRAARAPQEGPILGGARRLHRLHGLRRRLPDRHRHPRRLAARVHPVRAVHRCLQRHHGQDRPSARADRLRHDRQAGGGRQRRHGAAAADPGAHAALCGADRPGRRHHAGGARSTAPRSRSTCCTTAIRPTCCSPTAASATATPSRSSTSCTSRVSSASKRAGWRAPGLPSSAWMRARRSASQPTICASCACLSPCRRTEVAHIESNAIPFALVVRDVASGHETARTTQFQKPAGRHP